jgi:hypothetical protein
LRGECDYEPVDDLLEPLILTAAVSLSGRLDECEDDADLDAAARHGFALLDAGVITQEDINAETIRIFDELESFANAYELN